MIARHTQSTRVRSRRGAVAFETLLVLPLFLALVLGMVGIADLLIAEQLVAEASGRAARTAAIGGSEQEIRESVRAVLGSDRAEKARITVVPVSGEPGPVPPGGLIEARIELDVRDATWTRLAPVSGDDSVVGRAVMLRE